MTDTMTQPTTPVTQMGWLATWEADARKRLLVATAALANRLGVPAVDVEARQSRDPLPTPKAIGYLEANAITAEAIVRLAAEVDALRLDVAALRQERS
jgi:hypothetical protein